MEIKKTTKFSIGDELFVFDSSTNKLQPFIVSKIHLSVTDEGTYTMYFDDNLRVRSENDLYTSREEFISQL